MAKYEARIEVIDRDLTVLVPEAAPEEQNRLYQEFARTEIAKAREINRQAVGYMPDYELRVGGAARALSTATLADDIEAEFELANEMFKWIDDMLVLNSPIGRTGDRRPGHPELYARSHEFFADGNAVDPDGVVPKAEEYVFVNTQPYARKIERGLSAQAPDGVYQVVAKMAHDRFGNYGDIRFGYRTPFDFGAIHAWANTTSMQSPHRRGAKRDEWLRRQPAIVIRL